MIEKTVEFLKKREVEYKRSINLSSISTMRVGGIAEIIAYPSDIDELIDTVCFLKSNQIAFKIVGNMSNILPTDETYRGVILRTTRLNAKSVSGNIAYAECGVNLSNLCAYCSTLGLGGAEELFSIPATVGGSLAMNAGAFGKSVSDILLDANFYDLNSGETVCLTADNLGFSYRHSRILDGGLIVLSARFNLVEKKKSEIDELVTTYKSRRRSTQPLEYPSLGSIFKKCGETSAAYLIDQAGLKGLCVGGAQISPKHAGFIINRGNASAKDVYTLIEAVKSRVYERFGVLLEEEIEIM